MASHVSHWTARMNLDENTNLSTSLVAKRALPAIFTNRVVKVWCELLFGLHPALKKTWFSATFIPLFFCFFFKTSYTAWRLKGQNKSPVKYIAHESQIIFGIGLYKRKKEFVTELHSLVRTPRSKLQPLNDSIRTFVGQSNWHLNCFSCGSYFWSSKYFLWILVGTYIWLGKSSKSL